MKIGDSEKSSTLCPALPGLKKAIQHLSLVALIQIPESRPSPTPWSQPAMPRHWPRNVGLNL